MQKKIIDEILAHAFVRTVFKKYCWYFSDWMWWNYNWNCYEFCINKKDTYYCKKKTSTTARNVTSTGSKNCFSKKVRDCYILHSFISDHITIDIIIIYYC